METLTALQFTAAVLLVASMLTRQGKAPSSRSFWKPLFALLKSLRKERRPSRRRSVSMRGARPWWE